ncbi:MAG: tRNA 2-thiocytidine biosynthesis TtcA family protein [Defluviitaleaceae bacterium]|nr:tRNA 2-thiocytidine biosynthesis TtcA family protein [Defluviitaleaceae bacterium]
MKLQRLLSYTRRACDDYNMIEDGDHIAISMSGGKDSTALLVALAHMRRFYPKKFTIEGISVSLGLPGADFTNMQKLCDEHDVKYTVIETQIGEIIFDIRKEKNPCSLCTKMRKGAFNEVAKANGCNKIAYGHNKDDTIETLFLSLFYEGRIFSFAPVTFMDRMEVTAIRPLIYTPEREIDNYIKNNNIGLSFNNCSVDGKTKRQHIKEFIAAQGEIYPGLDEKVFGAITRSDIPGWNRGTYNE